MTLYLIDWNNGFIGGYTEHDGGLEQIFNTPKGCVFDDLKRVNATSIKIFTPEEFDEFRGYHMPSLQEYLCKTLLKYDKSAV